MRVRLLLLSATVLSSRLPAQQIPVYALAQLDRAVFTESVHSDITTQSGVSERHRVVKRMVQYSFVERGDTLIATADTVQLSEDADGIPSTINVDAVIGARWKFQLGAHGNVEVIDAPVVPRSIADISDIGTAMDDFLPPSPPRLAINAKVTDSAGRKWQRLADSGGVARYHFSGTRRSTTNTDGSGVAVVADENGTEITDLAWDAARGPVAFSRNLVTVVNSRFAGRTVRAQVQQLIVVERKRP